jgi:dipeptide transport system ATP-binding protein
MEERRAESLFAAPRHPYTSALIAAMPERHAGGTRLSTIPGVVPGLYDRPPGCLFAPRCAFAAAACDARPELRVWADGLVRCHTPLDAAAQEAGPGRDDAAAGATT